MALEIFGLRLCLAWLAALRPVRRQRGAPVALRLDLVSDHLRQDLGLPPRDPPRLGLWPPGRP